MAAGFTIESANLADFALKLEQLTAPLVTNEILNKKLKIDCELSFDALTWELAEKLVEFEPTGTGNPSPLFVAFGVSVLSAQTVGKTSKHLKLKLKQKEKTFDAIAFGMGESAKELSAKQIDIAYGLEINQWNGSKSLQLKIKGIKPPSVILEGA